MSHKTQGLTPVTPLHPQNRPSQVSGLPPTIGPDFKSNPPDSSDLSSEFDPFKPITRTPLIYGSKSTIPLVITTPLHDCNNWVKEQFLSEYPDTSHTLDSTKYYLDGYWTSIDKTQLTNLIRMLAIWGWLCRCLIPINSKHKPLICATCGKPIQEEDNE